MFILALVAEIKVQFFYFLNTKLKRINKVKRSLTMAYFSFFCIHYLTPYSILIHCLNLNKNKISSFGAHLDLIPLLPSTYC